MSSRLKITYDIDDGYGGSSRPHSLFIYLCDLEGLEGEQREAEIAILIEEDFRQTVMWKEISRYDVD